MKPKSTVMRILTALHTALGRCLAQLDPPAAVVSSRKTRDGYKPRRVRMHKLSRTHVDQHAAESPRRKERKRTSWFDCDPDVIHAALPRDPDEEVAERRRPNTIRIGRPRL